MDKNLFFVSKYYSKSMDNYTSVTNQYTKTMHGIEKLKQDIGNDLLSLGFFIGLIILIIGFVMLLLELYMVYKIYSINNWPITQNGGIVVNSYMENSTISSKYNIVLASSTQYIPYYRTSAAFIYKVKDNYYIGTKSSYYEAWNINAIIAKMENDTLQPGKKINIRINPNNPSEAYIYNKPYDRYYYLAFALGLFLIGLFIVISIK